MYGSYSYFEEQGFFIFEMQNSYFKGQYFLLSLKYILLI